MNARELVRRWKDRQSQILGQLPEAIRAEFHELTVAIRRAETELSAKRSATPENGRPSATSSQAPVLQNDFGQMLEKMSQRVPLENRKQQVVEFLAKNGPAARGEILSVTGIPNGSLSNVLLDQELFEKAGNLWKLVDAKESPKA